MIQLYINWTMLQFLFVFFIKTLHHPWFQSFVSVKKIFMLRRLEILKRLLAKTSLTKTKTLTKLLQVLCPLPQKLWGRPHREKWMEKAVACPKERGQAALIAEWGQSRLQDPHHYTVIHFFDVFLSFIFGKFGVLDHTILCQNTIFIEVFLNRPQQFEKISHLFWGCWCLVHLHVPKSFGLVKILCAKPKIYLHIVVRDKKMICIQ